MWWQDAVIYQIYPRSFQDSDGDGIGDLPGIERGSTTWRGSGVDALWLSPIYPSPMHDMGYDVADYKGVDPLFGTLEDFDRLVESARERGLRVLLDLVPCHTSIEHPWFTEHRDWYIWRDEPNNWLSAFGGSAWSELDGRFYLHSFYPEQPDLDWRNPEVVAAMQDALRFWVERGAAGYRVDAIDRLLKDPELRDDPPATEAFGLPLSEAEAKLALTNSRNAPDTPEALARIREAVDRHVLVGEVYLPSARWQPYLEHLDAAFAFELLHSEWDADRLRAAIEATTRAAGRGVGALEPRLRPAGHALRARERALGGDAPAHASRARPSSTRATRSGSATAPEGSVCTTAPGATASGTRCSGTARPPAASRPARPGCRRWTRSGRTSRRSATTRDRCSRSYATCSRPGGCSATESSCSMPLREWSHTGAASTRSR